MRIILIPAYNEENTIGDVVSTCKRWYENIRVLVVDNGSSDATAQKAHDAGGFVIHCEEQGYSQALKYGYSWALKHGVTELVQLDADGQHPPSAVGPLFANLRNYDWALASRHKLGCSGKFERRMASYFAGPFLRRYCEQPLFDWSSGMWGLNLTSLIFLRDQLPLRTMDANLRILANSAGLKLIEVPVAMDDRHDGVSMHDGLIGYMHLFSSAVQAWKACRRSSNLR